MNQYLLSVYEVEGAVDGTPQTPQEMQSFMARAMALEEEMDAAGASMLQRLGRLDTADDAYRRAAELAPAEAEARFLRKHVQGSQRPDGGGGRRGPLGHGQFNM
ncbi:hypothetical protein ACQPZF_21055 [Actinosynnema sp. CS-041913]|uniref:hypothetical protein n=1 Tax=Actinosynnema sp. CS-041913 TaxID=3239917 RepID=UPI003D8EE8C2